MSNPNRSLTREDRKAELHKMWVSGKKGQMAVLSMFRQAWPTGEPVHAGVSMIDVVVEKEFGPDPSAAQATTNSETLADA